MLPATQNKWTPHLTPPQPYTLVLDSPTPKGWKAELTLVTYYILRWFTCLQTITHPSTNRARCWLTTLTKANAANHCTTPSSKIELQCQVYDNYVCEISSSVENVAYHRRIVEKSEAHSGQKREHGILYTHLYRPSVLFVKQHRINHTFMIIRNSCLEMNCLASWNA